MTNQANGSREAFEIFAIGRNLNMNKWPGGSYVALTTLTAWDSWQAALSSPQSEPDSVLNRVPAIIKHIEAQFSNRSSRITMSYDLWSEVRKSICASAAIDSATSPDAIRAEAYRECSEMIVGERSVLDAYHKIKAKIEGGA